MADSEIEDTAARQRIISHMNTDHSDSLARYLEHFCQVSSSLARNARIDNITFDSLFVTSSNGFRYTIPFSPPMKSWSEARERVVAMDAEALKGLNRSNITVKIYKGPHGWMTPIFAFLITFFITFSTPSNFQPGSPLFDNLLRFTPRFAQLCRTIQRPVFLLVNAIHLGETIVMAQTRLRKHNIPKYSTLWWKWIVMTYFEGFANFTRFDAIVREEQETRDKRKH